MDEDIREILGGSLSTWEVVGIFDLMISKKEFLNVLSSLHIYM